jgi:branched-chain amino acid transport system substrate-binding protein
MKPTPNGLRVVVMTSAIASLIAACGSSSTSAGSNVSGIVKIGLLTSETGPIASFGVPAKDSLSYAISQVNGAGGFRVAGKTYKLQLVTVDDRSTVPGAVAGATQLIEDDQVMNIFGPLGPPAGSTAPIAARAGVLNFSASNVSAGLTGTSAYPLLFALEGDLPSRNSAIVSGIKYFLPHAKTIAILGPDDTELDTLGKPVQKTLDSEGYKTSLNSFPITQSDFSALLTRVASTHPDAIVTWAASEGLVQALFQQLNPSGIGKNVALFDFGGPISDCRSYAGGRPCIADPVVSVDNTSPDASSQVKAFNQAMLKFTGATALPAEPQSWIYYYDPLFLLVKAMESAGTVSDTKSIATALTRVKYNGLGGDAGFDQSHFFQAGFDLSFVPAGGGSIITKHFD